MRSALLSLIFVLTACASADDTSAFATNLIVVQGPVTAGTPGAAIFRNQTGNTLRIGDLGCAVAFDVLERAAWQPLTADVPTCPGAIRLLAPDDSISFTIEPPAVPGIYRIRYDAVVDFGPTTGQSTLQYGVAPLHSEPFEVRSPSLRTP